jgi:hypothetical protein
MLKLRLVSLAPLLLLAALSWNGSSGLTDITLIACRCVSLTRSTTCTFSRKDGDRVSSAKYHFIILRWYVLLYIIEQFISFRRSAAHLTFIAYGSFTRVCVSFSVEDGLVMTNTTCAICSVCSMGSTQTCHSCVSATYVPTICRSNSTVLSACCKRDYVLNSGGNSVDF